MRTFENVINRISKVNFYLLQRFRLRCAATKLHEGYLDISHPLSGKHLLCFLSTLLLQDGKTQLNQSKTLLEKSLC